MTVSAGRFGARCWGSRFPTIPHLRRSSRVAWPNPRERVLAVAAADGGRIFCYGGRWLFF